MSLLYVLKGATKSRLQRLSWDNPSLLQLCFTSVPSYIDEIRDLKEHVKVTDGADWTFPHSLCIKVTLHLWTSVLKGPN